MATGRLDEGVTVAGRYTLVEALGEGGFGEVWKARDTKLDRLVAMKFMRPQLVGNASLRRRFERESRALAAIRHPNVVQVFDDGEWEGRPFVVLEYIDGGTLRDWLESHRKLRKGTPLAEVRSLFVQVCDGVAAAHRVQIVHRDLKPENVLIEYNDEGRAVAKVLDFGLARVGEGQSSVALQVGTYAYMSPEQAAEGSDAVGAASDVFSLGVMLVELLTGRVLPEETSKAPWERAVLAGKATGALARLRGVRAEVPEAVWEVVSGALAGEAEQRYANAGEMRRATVRLWDDGNENVAREPQARMWSGRDDGTSAPLASVALMPSMVEVRSSLPVDHEVPSTGSAISGAQRERDRSPRLLTTKAALVIAAILASVSAIGLFFILRKSPLNASPRQPLGSQRSLTTSLADAGDRDASLRAESVPALRRAEPTLSNDAGGASTTDGSFIAPAHEIFIWDPAIFGASNDPPLRHPQRHAMEMYRQALTPHVQSCFGTNPPHGRHVRMVVVYEGTTGRIHDLHIAGASGQPPIGACIENVMRAHPVPPFTDNDFEIGFIFVIE